MIKIAIDAGHGSNTAGKRTPVLPDGTVIREHIANVGVANFLEIELQRCGFATLRVAWNDTNAYDDPDVALAERQRIIRDAKCDVVISCHMNAFGSDAEFNAASGVGIYIHNQYAGDSKALASVVMKYLVQGTKQKNRGITPQALALCNCKAMGVSAAILPELAFMTNLHEATTMVGNVEFWKECAVEIARGVCEYFNVTYIIEGTKIPKRVTRTSSKEDIIWLQSKLARLLVCDFDLKVTGVYDDATRIAVLLYWLQLGWGKDMIDDGTVAGKKTCVALAENRVK